MNWLEKIVRPEILNLKAYSSARGEYSGAYSSGEEIYLDANESPQMPYADKNNSLNRYPEPQPIKLKKRLAEIYKVSEAQLLITRGMDEGIDLLIRVFCVPNRDSIAINSPTFGYYAVAANINAVGVIEGYAIGDPKIIFLCTPNNPTGATISLAEIKALCVANNERGIIAVDEAYIEFADESSATILLQECPNLVVMRTLSKAYGLAAARIGALIADPKIIALLRKVISPYPISALSAKAALEALSPIGLFYAEKNITQIKEQREYLYQNLLKAPSIEKVYKSSANFLLVIAKDAEELYQNLKRKGIIVRSRTGDIPSALRITVGNLEENNLLLAALDAKKYDEEPLIRKASQSRKTFETEVMCCVTLDEKGLSNITTGIGFFDHMLAQLSKHSGISMTIKAIGDIDIDVHHSVEDVAIVLGQTLKQALGEKVGLNRYGFLLPMDETEVKVSIDLSGRGFCKFAAEFKSPFVGEFPCEMVKHFFESFSTNLGCALHINATGENTHHMIEAIFKCVAKALGQAVAINGSNLPSTKGML